MEIKMMIHPLGPGDMSCEPEQTSHSDIKTCGPTHQLVFDAESTEKQSMKESAETKE